jgi:asparagine synthase (glutamine-hydrolysing)
MMAALDDWVYFNDDPVGDPSALALMILSRRVHASGLKVALAGEGADELFGGYSSYARYVLALGQQKICGPLFAEWSVALDFRLHDYLSQPDSPFWGSAHVTSARMRQSLLGSTSAELVNRMREIGAGQSPLRRAMQVDLAVRLPSDLLMRTDRATMASSLEVRVPFLSNQVLGISRGLTDSQLMRVLPFSSKRLLKRLTAAHVGRDAVYRRKVGFDLPIAKWLSGPFSRQIEGMLHERMIDCLNYEVISTWYGQLRKGKAMLAPVIWSWLTLELWYRRWVVESSSPLN